MIFFGSFQLVPQGGVGTEASQTESHKQSVQHSNQQGPAVLCFELELSGFGYF